MWTWLREASKSSIKWWVNCSSKFFEQFSESISHICTTLTRSKNYEGHMTSSISSDALLPLFKLCLTQCTKRSSLEKRAIFFFLTSTIILSSLRFREEKFDCRWSKHCYEIAEGCIAGANRQPSPAHFEKLDAPVFQSLPLSLSAEELWETACSWK